MKGMASSFITSRFTSMPVSPRMKIFAAQTLQETIAAFFVNTAPATNVRTASRAVHGTKGVSRIVRSLALRDSMILAPRTAGTLHPNPRHMGIKLLP